MFRLFPLIFALLAVPVFAEPIAIQAVKVGIETCYKNGHWTPVVIDWANPIPEGTLLASRCSDSDGTPITYKYSVGGNRSVVLAKMGRKNEPLQIGFNGGNFCSYEVPAPVNSERPVYLVIGNEDIGLQGAIAELALREERRPMLVKVKSLADLPEQWFGLETIEMIVWTTTEPQIFDGFTADSPQIKAIDDWLKFGGKMLLCAGKNAGALLENQDGLLRPFLPGQFAEMTELRHGTPFETYVNSKRQIVMNGTSEAPFMKMPRFTEPRGIISIKDGDLPLMLHCAHGFGTIIYFGGDLSDKPLGNWRDRTALVRSMMQWNAEKGNSVNPRAGTMLQLGYNDISGQIRSALDQFEGVRIVPFSVILILLTVYWLVIGLFDWFLVHKILKRPILTWVTFPCWIVLFSALTYLLADQGRPNRVLTNTLTIYDADSETGLCFASMWKNLYSPEDRSENVVPHRVDNKDKASFSWNGLSGSGLGGMAPKTVSPTVWKNGSEQQTYSLITNVPIQVRSTKSFFGQSPLEKQKVPLLKADLSDEEGVPIGTLEIPEEFSEEEWSLNETILVYGRWMLELGAIKGGTTIKMTKNTQRRELRDLLLPKESLGSADLRRLAAYNPQSADLDYIVRVMSLHRVLGGYEATGLHHAYQQSLDRSDLLSADRALLIARINSGEQTAFYRQSFPIKLTVLSPRLKLEQPGLKPDELEQKIRPEFIRDKSSERKQ
jgi:hypothetical protein